LFIFRLADLQRLINQPASYLKELLTGIANYNSTQPHKNTWELKPEYRSYGHNEPTLKDSDEDDEEFD
jgi:transcription initiation factor TFIIF subunit beta